MPTVADFTRLTIVGTSHTAELVIPTDEALAGLLPRLMDLLGEPAGSVDRPLRLARSTGEQLDVALTADEQDVVDGDLLRFVRADDAPAPPEVADVTDVVGESLADRAGRWSTGSRELTGALALGGLAAAVAALAPTNDLLRVVGVAALVLAAVAVGRRTSTWGAVALTAMALGVCLPLGVHLATQRLSAGGADPGALRYGLASTLLVGLGWMVLGVGFGLGVGRRAALGGGLVGAPLAVLPLVLVATGLVPLAAVAITAVVAAVICGLLPGYALTVSGLTGLDDQVVEGRLRHREEVAQTVHEAYRSLSWTTYAVALPQAATMAWLLASVDLWAAGLGALVAVVTALRTRSFPLTAQQLPLWLATLTGMLAGLVRQPRLDHSTTAWILTGVAVLVVLLVLARPPAHRRAFWRRAGNGVEAVAVVALIPTLLGLLGVYSDLLGAFHR